MHKLSAFVSIVLLASQAAAQSFTVFNYAVPEGAPSNEVYHVFQDRSGFVWFATDNGVVKFGWVCDDEDNAGRLRFRTFSEKVFYYKDGKCSSIMWCIARNKYSVS